MRSGKSVNDLVDKIIDRKSREVDPSHVVRSRLYDFAFAVILLVCSFVILLIGMKSDYSHEFLEAINRGNNGYLFIGFAACAMAIYFLITAGIGYFDALKEKRLIDQYMEQDE